MTNEEICKELSIGGIVPKRILAAMKRKGLIYDYSQWGYLESARIDYKDQNDSWYEYVELFPKGNAKDAENFTGTSQKLRETFFGGNITYKGCTFDTKYLDGCFQPYLVKTGPKTEKTREVNHRMCFFGAII